MPLLMIAVYAPSGASSINCWKPTLNSLSWYSLGLNLRWLVSAPTQSTNHEESQLSQPRLHSIQRKSYYSLWLLPNEVGQTSSLPVSDLWEDILLDDRYGVSSTPAPASYF